jgi:hypothetical protein
MMKEFRDTKYLVNENGDIFRFGKKRKLHINKYGYNEISLSIRGKQKTFLVHRMVAECYLPNHNNLPQVDHKDFNKTNNSVRNLEWVTGEENVKRSLNFGRQKIWRNQYSKKIDKWL